MHPCIFLLATPTPLQSLSSSRSLLSDWVQPVGSTSIRGNGGRRDGGVSVLNPSCFDPETVAGAPVTPAPRGRQPLTMAPGLMGLKQHSFLPICWVHGVGGAALGVSLKHSESVSCSVVSNSCNTVDCSLQDPLSMKFSRQEYWSELPFPSPGDLSNPRIKSRSPAL